MDKHQFTLILSGVSELAPELADALYEATDGDVELDMRDSIAYLEAERLATSLDEAITSVMQEVESAGVGVKVVRVESEAANTVARINVQLLGAPTVRV